jgi:hypothetical protein
MPPPGQVQRAASKFIVFENFEKLNTQSVRQALSEKELAWLENLQPIAGNNLTTVPGPNTALTSINATIKYQYFANLGTVDYVISFTTDGAGWATNIATNANTQFAPPTTFTNPDMTVWQSAYVLINDPTAAYCVWNGTVFVKQGGVDPVIIVTAPGNGYNSAPTVTISGGSGSGATAVATIGTPQLAIVTVTNQGSGYTSAPGVVFTGGGGSGGAATATISLRSVITTHMTNSGAGYTLTPAAVVSGGGGSGAALRSNMVSDGAGELAVGSLTILSGGTGYTSIPNITFDPPTFGINTASATCTVDTGQVLSIAVTNRGSGYTSAPAVSFTGGGGGSGAAAFAVVGGSGVTGVTLTNPGGGYLAGDTLTVGFSGGGGGSGATATAQRWQFAGGGTSPTTIAVFQGRVWLGSGRSIQYSSTAGFDDFSGGAGAAVFTLNDADLVHGVTALRAFNNYLFIMGDQSVKQIGNISLNAAGTVTLFTILTLSSDQGTIYPRSCGSFNRVFMFANSNGIYAVLGSSVQKISDDLDGIFRLIDFSQQPMSAIADFNNIHNITWLVLYIDPLSTTRSILLTFNGKKWFVVSQGDSLAAITTASTLASGKNLTFATSGQDITQILGSATTPVTFKLQTALTHHGNAVQRKKTMRGGAAVTASGSVNMTLTLDTNEGTQTYTRALTSGFQALSWTEDGSGRYLGATITGTLSGFTVTNATIELQETNVGNK